MIIPQQELFAVIDIETTSLKLDTKILEIGVSISDYFNIISTFSVTIDVNSHKGDVSPDTDKFWRKQPVEVSKAVHSGITSLKDALGYLDSFLYSYNPDGDLDVYGNGPAFDLATLRYRYEELNRQVPWRHNRESCLRTLKKLYPSYKRFNPTTPYTHRAVDDASHEAEIINYIFMCHRGK